MNPPQVKFAWVTLGRSRWQTRTESICESGVSDDGWVSLQIFRGSYGKARPKPKKKKRSFGMSRPDLKPVPVPEPPPHKATPESFPPAGGGIDLEISDDEN